MFRRAATLIAALALTPALAEEPPLKTAVDATFAPHAMPTLGGDLEGFNIDLAHEIGKRLGRKVEITGTQYSGILPALQAGTYDFVAAPTTATPERAQNLLFTEGYLNTDYQFVVRRDTPDIASLDGFKGKVISVNKGSAYDKWARDLEPELGWKVESFGTNADAIQAVIAGRAFASVAGNTAEAWAVKNNPQIKLSFLYSTGLVWSVPLRKDDVALRNRIEDAIECMKRDGTMARMHEKWFGTRPAPGSAAVTVFPGYGIPDYPGYDPAPHQPNCR